MGEASAAGVRLKIAGMDFQAHPGFFMPYAG